MLNKNLFIGFFIILTIGLAAWITLSHKSKPLVTIETKVTPDAFMEDVITTVMDEQGRPSIKLVTPKMTHYAENDTMHIVSPQLTLYRKSPRPWYINSLYAESTHGLEQVVLHENVVIQHPADIDHPATLIKTTTLTLHPNQKTAETMATITMIQPSLTVKAIGMRADMTTGNINLLSEARGEYEPG